MQYSIRRTIYIKIFVIWKRRDQKANNKQSNNNNNNKNKQNKTKNWRVRCFYYFQNVLTYDKTEQSDEYIYFSKCVYMLEDYTAWSSLYVYDYTFSFQSVFAYDKTRQCSVLIHFSKCIYLREMKE